MIKKTAVVILLAVFFLLTLTSVSTKSPICDEASHHIGAGYSYIKTHDFRLTPSPPLLRLLMGFPLVFLNPKLPTDHISWQNAQSAEFNYQFLFVYNNNADQIVFWSRIPMIVVAALLGFLIFLWAKKAYGYNAGIVALFLYAFSPAILGNAGLAMLDLGCAAFMFAAVYQFYRYLENQTVFNLLLSGVLYGLAQATKITALALYPIFFIFIIIYFLHNNKGKKSLSFVVLFRNLILIWAIGILVLWATYFFEFKPLLKNEPDVQEKIEYIKKFSVSLPLVKDKERAAEELVKFANNAPIPLSTYGISIMGFGRQVVMGDQPVFFMGRNLFRGSRIYYVVDYLIKTPLPEIIILIASIFLWKKRKNIGFTQNIFIILPLSAFFIIASISRLQSGLRYILPAYPFLYVFLAGVVTTDFGKFKKAATMLFSALLIWYAASSLAAFPDYLAYYNEIAGGPDGFGYAITSDGDWGQDFKALKRVMDKEGIKKIRLNCFGSVNPSYYGIDYSGFTQEDFVRPEEGIYYAISSRNLPSINWAKSARPAAKAGKTIFVYHIAQKGG